MKRVFCVLISLCLIFGLFSACGEQAAKEESSGAPDATASASPTDGEETASVEKKAAFIPLAVGTEFFQQMAKVFVEKFTAAGWTAEYASPEADPAKQIEIIENYVAMDFDVLVVYPVSGEGLSSAVQNARDAGVKVIVMVEETQSYDAILRAAGAKIINAQLEMAADWVEQRFPDAEDRSIPCAAVTFTQTSTMAEYTEEIVKIEDYSDKITLETVYEVSEDSSAAGQQAAENIYTTNPDIKLFVCVSGTVAYGVNNYYTALNGPVDDLSQIAVFGVNGSTESYAAVQDSGSDEAVLRGIASVAGINATIDEMLELAEKLMAGTLEDPERDGKIDKITVDNVEDFMF